MRDRRSNDEAGIALVLALLSLMLLTFLGLALAASTSTELQIANNYRWSQQAFYNAEAGLEVAKKVLGTAAWSDVVPDRRSISWLGTDTPVRPKTPTTGSRDYENYGCDYLGHGMGYGVVLQDKKAGLTFANVSSGAAAYSQVLHGAFTIWLRREVVLQRDGGQMTGFYEDSSDNTRVVVTAEGVAPYRGDAAGTALAQQYQAVRTLEATYTNSSVSTSCGGPFGQAGGGSEGAGFGKCFSLDPNSVGAALGMTTNPAAIAGVK